MEGAEVAAMAVILFEDMAESLSFGNRPAFESRVCCFLLRDLEQASGSLKYKSDIRMVLWDFGMKHPIVLNFTHKGTLTNVSCF